MKERRLLANDVRVPAVAEGEAIVVGRYAHERPKAVILHPDDYVFLCEAAALVDEVDALTESFSDGAIQAREIEDRPRDELLVEDSAGISELLGL
jgi:hypothetical protein